MQSQSPLRLLLTGPRGTGKTHVVRTLSKLMEEYGHAHRLRLIAPTGSAASLIDASTIHKGLGIKIKRRKDGKSSTSEAPVGSITKTRLLTLELEWRGTDWLFVDECSLVGSPLLAELDQNLRVIKGKEEWFGGINLVLAGDFSQYPPVLSTPLYEPIGPNSGSKTNEDFLKRLGRLARLSVNSVIELEEQKRMSQDAEYGKTVARLRMRQCVPGDVQLFNARVLPPHAGALGVGLTRDQSLASTTIVKDNRTRWLLNGMKASATVQSNVLVICAAKEFKRQGEALKGAEREAHLLSDFSSTAVNGGLPSFIPLAVGMKVVLRNRNFTPQVELNPTFYTASMQCFHPQVPVVVDVQEWIVALLAHNNAV